MLMGEVLWVAWVEGMMPTCRTEAGGKLAL